jgi:hypothetical protein
MSSVIRTAAHSEGQDQNGFGLRAAQRSAESLSPNVARHGVDTADPFLGNTDTGKCITYIAQEKGAFR